MFAAALVATMATAPAFATGWTKTTSPQIAPPTTSQGLDPLGDHLTSIGNPVVDISFIAGELIGPDMRISIDFSLDTVMTEVAGFIELDTDQNPLTGLLSSGNLLIPGTMQDIGAEFQLDLFSILVSGLVDIKETATGMIVGSVPAVITGQNLEILVPLAIIGVPSAVNVGMVLGNMAEPTDAAPNTGYLTIGVGTVPPSSLLSISPASGKLLTNQTFDLVLIAEGGVIGGAILINATLDGQNVTNYLASCLIPGTLINPSPAGSTLTCPRLTGAKIGVGTHALSVTVDIDGLGNMATQTVHWDVLNAQ